MQFNNPPRKIKNNMTTPTLKKSIGSSPSRLALLLIPLVFTCFALCPQVQATPDPGSVDPFNTADGDHALFSNTTGVANVAIGWYALFGNTEGSNNTAVGAAALDLNAGNNNTAVGTAALLLNTGSDNTAVGIAALELNTTGERQRGQWSVRAFQQHHWQRQHR